jgi:hypothetical protein
MAIGHPIQVRLQPHELEALDQYRREQRSPATRARTVRELACRALKLHIKSDKALHQARARGLLPTAEVDVGHR